MPPATTAFMPAGAGAGVAPARAMATARAAAAAAAAATMEAAATREAAAAAAAATTGAAVGGDRAADGAGRVAVEVVAAAAVVCRAERRRTEKLCPRCSHPHSESGRARGREGLPMRCAVGGFSQRATAFRRRRRVCGPGSRGML